MNDIFISYAHLDDQALDEDQKGWITKFHRVLQVKLGQLLGEQATIWRDEKLSGSDVYDDKIVNEFKNANAQDYSGEHPDEAHPVLKIDGKERNFRDKGRNSISVVGKGSIYKDIMGAGFESHNNLSQPNSVSTETVRNYDYDYLDKICNNTAGVNI